LSADRRKHRVPFSSLREPPRTFLTLRLGSSSSLCSGTARAHAIYVIAPNAHTLHPQEISFPTIDLSGAPQDRELEELKTDLLYSFLRRHPVVNVALTRYGFNRWNAVLPRRLATRCCQSIKMARRPV
jgi:hypothetical protein